MQDFDAKFDSFLTGAQAIIDAYTQKMVETSDKPAAARFAYTKKLSPVKGRRYIKVVEVSESGGSSVFCFVDLKTGNVLKAASWSSPAKGARGNIFDDHNGLGRMGPYGPAYNR